MSVRTDMKYKAIIAIAIIIVVGFITYSVLVKKEKPTITTTGTAQMKVPPDQLVVYSTVQTRNISAEAAKNQNAVISNNF